jgi:hypothetical protein
VTVGRKKRGNSWLIILLCGLGVAIIGLVVAIVVVNINSGNTCGENCESSEDVGDEDEVGDADEDDEYPDVWAGTPEEYIEGLESIMSQPITDEERADSLPERDDFTAVYTVLKRELRVEHRVYSIRALRHLLMTKGYNISYVKLKAIIMIFRELNVVGVEDTDRGDEVYEFSYVFVKNKTSLDKSGILKKMRNELRPG